ncbi:Facilitated trehalose transporter Tret1-like protein [Dinothrombium tinctorium]|uniref:Facilitated trehalose transporter Tret1-like protein n=1 Tax=Dinothrombium tinctorium TaxID=1965070 RepID=A0A443QHK8_9ACAR|nr:Facilitated trehalose transporter Tret1-like protein [Dinothrombium tinctorium]
MVIEASLKVYLAAVCTLLGPICFGIAIGYSSPAFETLLRINGTEGKENSRNRIASKTDCSLISAAITLGALLGSLAGGFISQTLGRKKALVIYGLPYATGCAIIFFAKSVPVIVTGRFITGIITGMICTAAPTYIVEISTPKTRGLLGTSFQLCIVTGIFIMSVFGIFSTKEFNYFFNWRYLALIGIMPSLALSITMFFMPESPAWLLSRYGRSSLKPEKALTKLRTPNSDIQKELNEINEVISESKSVLITFEELKKPEVWKPLLLGIGLMFFQQFSGINVVMFFQTQILEEAGASSPAVGTALTCFAQLASTFVGAYIMDKLGRRKLLLISGGGHTASLFTLGLYFYFREKQEIELNFIPVVCLIVYIVAFAIGYGPVAWLMIPEMTPTTARSFLDWKLFNILVVLNDMRY